jgi:site-specific recombinase XerD
VEEFKLELESFTARAIARGLSANTIKSYKSDIADLLEFLDKKQLEI